MVNPISLNNAATNKPADIAQVDPSAKLGGTPAKAVLSNADVVSLSDSAQAKLLKQEGLNVSEIAIKLGLDVKTVSSYIPSVDIKPTGS